jgi:hypothetical protein
MSIARHHAEWLSLIEVSGPFLSMPILMRVFPQGLEGHDADRFRLLRVAYEEWDDNNQAGRRQNPAIHHNWIKFILRNILELPETCIAEGQAIPQSLQTTIAEQGETLRPSLAILEQGSLKPRLLIQTYPVTQNLSKPVAGSTWKASPDTRMMELLHATGVRLGLVTNGEQWMLVDAPRNETTGFASWYAHLWLEEKVTLQAFVSLLNANRFFGVSEKDTLEKMLEESASNQQEVTDQLGYQVRKAVEVLVESLDRADQDHGRELLANIPETTLYEAALTVMMRLVFLFCAEERGLILLGDAVYDENYAVSTLEEQLRETADQHGEEILERRHDAWCRLLSTFRGVFGGIQHERMTLPAYGGKLFDPDRFPFLEGRKLGTSWRYEPAVPLPVNNRTVLHLLDALQFLQVKVPGGGPAEARRLSFRALDIEQIGHVYEGLLDHTAKRAIVPVLGLAGGRDCEPEIALPKLEEIAAKGEDILIEFLKEQTGRSVNALKKALHEEMDLTTLRRFEGVCGASAEGKKLFERIKPFVGLIRDDTFGYPVVIAKGSVYVTAGTDRRSSGTHYTPKSLTEPIVQYTLEPLVYSGPAEGKPKEQWKLRSAKELLALKICDMTCGSGAFDVQVCRYLSERLMEAWENAEENNPQPANSKLRFPTITPEGLPATGAPGEMLIPRDPDERVVYARRIIAQRCLYGVDINPLAAEMAKLSLWLLTLAKDKPFTFLDHTIRCGDSLLGIHDLKQLTTFSLDGKGEFKYLFAEPLDKLVSEAVELRLKIETMASNTVEDVQEQDRLMVECERKMAFLKCVADMLMASELKGGSPKERLEHRDHAAIQVGFYLKEGKLEEFKAMAKKELGGRRCFHWPLEFPEVFAQGRFDAFVGNPPFKRGKDISGMLGTQYRELIVSSIAQSARGSADLVVYFFLVAYELLRERGCFGLLGTNTISEGDSREVGLDRLLRAGGTIFNAAPDFQWPGDASLTVSRVHVYKGHWGGVTFLSGSASKVITSLLNDEGHHTPQRLFANQSLSYQGTNILGLGFTMPESDARELLLTGKATTEVLLPYLGGQDVTDNVGQTPSRWVISFWDWPLCREQSANGYMGPVAADYPVLLDIVKDKVKPERDQKNRKQYRDLWWLFAEKQKALYFSVGRSKLFIDGVSEAAQPVVVVQVMIAKYVAPVVVPNNMIFSHRLVVFTSEPYSTLAIVQSTLHQAWVLEFGGTLETRMSYTPSDSFETFPLPAMPHSVCQIGRNYSTARESLMKSYGCGLTAFYNRFHNRDDTTADIHKFRDLHLELDKAVAGAYGWGDLKLDHGFHQTKQGLRFTISEPARREVLARLLKLNHERHAEEVAQGLHDKKKSKAKGRSKAADSDTAGLFAGPVDEE